MTKDNLGKEKAISQTKKRLCSVINSAFTINTLYNKTLDISTLLDELLESTKMIRNDNTNEIEMILIAQAKTLDALFHRLLTEMIDSEYTPNLQALGDIALRAQNQSRRTLATLADLKSPKRATFIKQQNNAINQQVNNNPEKSKISGNLANELISEVGYEKVDTVRTVEAISAGKKSEAMATLDRTKNVSRENPKQDECL